MDKIWYRNPSKSEVIGRCGGDEKTEWPRRTNKSRTLKIIKKIIIKKHKQEPCDDNVGFMDDTETTCGDKREKTEMMKMLKENLKQEGWGEKEE